MSNLKSNYLLKDNAKELQAFYAYRVAGIVLFMFISVAIHFTNTPPLQGSHYTNVVIGGCSLFVFIAFLMADRFYVKEMAKQDAGNLIAIQKLEGYRGALLCFTFIIDAGACAAIACFIATGNYIYLAWVGVVIFRLVEKFPTSSRITTIVCSP